MRRDAGQERCRSVWELEGVRHDSDDPERLIVQKQHAADGGSLALQSLLPERFTDDRDIGRIGGGERSADEWRNPEHGEEGRLGLHRHHTLGTGACIQVPGGHFVTDETIERSALGSVFGEVRYGVAPRKELAGTVHLHQALGMRKRERPQEDTVDHAEHGSVRANAEGEREHRRRRETSAATEHTSRVGHILHHVFDDRGAARAYGHGWYSSTPRRTLRVDLRQQLPHRCVELCVAPGVALAHRTLHR